MDHPKLSDARKRAFRRPFKLRNNADTPSKEECLAAIHLGLSDNNRELQDQKDLTNVVDRWVQANHSQLDTATRQELTTRFRAVHDAWKFTQYMKYLKSSPFSEFRTAAQAFLEYAQDNISPEKANLKVNMEGKSSLPNTTLAETKPRDSSAQSPKHSEERGNEQEHSLTDALRQRIDEAPTTEIKASPSNLSPDKTSDSTLTEQYNFLLRSTHFQHLAKIVNSERKITLHVEIPPGIYDNPYVHIAIYLPHYHMIHIPQKRPDGTTKSVEDIREDLLYEMHNASIKDHFVRCRKKFFTLEPNQNASHKEKEIYPYRMATYALIMEWLEWTNTIEHSLRCKAINADPNMGAGESHVTDTYHDRIRPDGIWRTFDGYLKYGIEKKHTTYFDPHAEDDSWVGKHLLAIEKKRSPAQFEITESEVEGWLTRKDGRIKPLSNIPFYSDAIIEEALQQARIQQASQYDFDERIQRAI